MRAGKLDSTITLQRSTNTVEPDGAPVFTWTDIATMRAEIVTSNTEEFIRAYGASDESRTLFRLRYLDGITPADRIVLDGRIYEITSATEIRRRRGLEIMAVAK